METRASGVLLHPTSLPGAGGIGDLGPAAERFLDWLGAAGQGLWQVLPLGPTGHGNSPYGATSSFAGNPLLISPQRLVEAGLAADADLGELPPAGPRVDYPAVIAWKEPWLRRVWERTRSRPAADLEARIRRFREALPSAAWLDDWVLYRALKARHGGGAWWQWPAPVARREPAALAAARRELASEIELHVWIQFVFFTQWRELRRAARRRGIRVFGDLPFYPHPDSADVWARQDLFELDADGRPLAVSGVPPDAFTAEGQHWGNPVYRWQRLAAEGFSWWIRRLQAALATADLVRLDHFRGYQAYWRIPAGEPAAAGAWVEAPGAELFTAVRRALGELPLVAEDLGVITPAVVALRRRFGLPGVRVLQFGFSEIDSLHLPHRFEPDLVAYTGTHDNDTTRGWAATLGAADRERLTDYLGGGAEPHVALARAAMTSVAGRVVLPAQDLLGLGNEARMNTPGRASGNWEWRLGAGGLSTGLAAELRRLTELSGRLARPQAGREADG